MSITPEKPKKSSFYAFANCRTVPYYFDIDGLRDFAQEKGIPMSELTLDEKLQFVFLKKEPGVPVDKGQYCYYSTSKREPVNQKDMEYGYDFRGLRAYAKKTGLPIEELTTDEKLQFLFLRSEPDKPVDMNEYEAYMDMQRRRYADIDIDAAIYVAENP